ncbi:uncharacterized protein LOC144422009 [Styela clava]
MPSPSRIPRPNRYVSKKNGNENKVETKKSVPSYQNKNKTAHSNSNEVEKSIKAETKTVVKGTTMAKQKKSPLRVVQENKFRQQEKKENHSVPKTTFHDRRGISEIKRSEQNLRLTLDFMEHDVEALKHDLKSVKMELQKSKNDVMNLSEKEINLQEKMEFLKEENTRQAEILETIDRDPVTMSKLDLTPEFKSLLVSQEQKQITVAFDLKNCLTDLKTSLNEMDERLDNLNFENVTE